MNYTIDDISKITRFKTWSIKKKVDTLLRIDSHMYTNLGLDSTAAEKKKAKTSSRKIYRAITQVSPIDGYFLEAHMNEKDLTENNK
tara:strand:- start:990 stop:1247 length:258 start_codon:yes stop_codon:yes gene_type:complete